MRIQFTVRKKLDMPASSRVRLLLSVVCLLALSRLPAQADIVFDNSDTGGTNVYYPFAGVVEFGDEVILKGGAQTMSEFAFEYYGNFVAGGDETARLRLYKADGPVTPSGDATPGTLLYDSGAFGLVPGWQTKTFSGLSLAVPGDVIWTVEFTGITGGAGDQAGLVFRQKPSVGDSYDDFWQKASGKWLLYNFSQSGGPVANFAARIISGSAGSKVGIRREPNKVIIEWTGLSVLQTASEAKGPYTDVPNVRNRYEFTPGPATPFKFWRLRD